MKWLVKGRIQNDRKNYRIVIDCLSKEYQKGRTETKKISPCLFTHLESFRNHFLGSQLETTKSLQICSRLEFLGLKFCLYHIEKITRSTFLQYFRGDKQARVVQRPSVFVVSIMFTEKKISFLKDHQFQKKNLNLTG